MSLQNAFGDLALDATLVQVLGGRYSGGKSAVTATATSSGDTTVYTPTAGKKVRLYWISCINDPDSSLTPLVKVKLGSAEFYRGYAIAHWEVFDGATNAALIVNLDEAGSVSITAHYAEIV